MSTDINNSKVAIGIIGGVGPEAGCMLNKLIIEETQDICNARCDQEHLECYHISMPQIIEDRTKYLIEHNCENPAHGAFQALSLLEDIGKIRQDTIYTGIPCNTFHSPEIFQELERLINNSDISHVKLFNMIEETTKYISKTFPNEKNIGLLSTTGTRKSRLYNQYLETKGFNIIELDEFNQAKIHQSIYDTDWGIKAKSPVSLKARDNFFKFIQMLKDQGCKIVILGCTEIPLALPKDSVDGIKLIDPMRILAHVLVKNAHDGCVT